MDKLGMKTKDISKEKFEILKELFPNAVTETVSEKKMGGGTVNQVSRTIDIDVLRQEINGNVVEGKEERYEFTWPEKKKAIIEANSPINKTLRPIREESVNFDTTENLYIEGDNLEALKLLRETYLGKIKMIYIDPPYNTGKDFIYNDDFSQSEEEYNKKTSNYDEDGNRLFKNTDSNGRFHTDWLNMMYPRLKLARDLLTDDGVIFISIDDNEQANLKKVCDEIFGAINFISNLIIKSAPAGTQSSNDIAIQHSYSLIYRKTMSATISTIPLTERELLEKYNYDSDENGRYYIERLWKRGIGGKKEDVPSLHFPVYYSPKKELIFIDDEKKDENLEYIKIIPYQTKEVLGRWTWSREKMKAEKNLLKIALVNGEYKLYKKMYISEDKGRKPYSLIGSEIGRTELGSIEIREILKGKYFDYPKSTLLIQYFLRMVDNKNSIILDFFSGSATTAHAVMQLNAEDGGNRKYIMVQLPEETAKDSDAYKAGYKNICEIGKERIRRAAKKLKEENPNSKFDDGFRVLRVDSSNMKDVYYKPEEFTQENLKMFESNIKEDRSGEDLLFQVMLDLGIELSNKIEEKFIQNNKIYDVGENFLIACFDENITEEVVIEIAKLKPFFAIFKEGNNLTDNTLINFEEIFKTYSPDTKRRVL